MDIKGMQRHKARIMMVFPCCLRMLGLFLPEPSFEALPGKAAGGSFFITFPQISLQVYDITMFPKLQVMVNES